MSRMDYIESYQAVRGGVFGPEVATASHFPLPMQVMLNVLHAYWQKFGKHQELQANQIHPQAFSGLCKQAMIINATN